MPYTKLTQGGSHTDLNIRTKAVKLYRKIWINLCDVGLSNDFFRDDINWTSDKREDWQVKLP